MKLHIPGVQSLERRRWARLETKVSTYVSSQSNLLSTPSSSIIPEKPIIFYEQGGGLVDRVSIPGKPPVTTANNWVGRMSLPIGNAVSGASNSNSSRVNVAKSDVKHNMPRIVHPHTRAGDLNRFPRKRPVRSKYRVVKWSRPLHAIRTLAVTDCVRLVLLSTGIPHPESVGLHIPDHVRAHDSNFFPGALRYQHRT